MKNKNSQKKKYKWIINTWKYGQHHQSQRNCKLKPSQKLLHDPKNAKDKKSK